MRSPHAHPPGGTPLAAPSDDGSPGEERPLAIIEKSATEEIRVCLNRYKGAEYVDIRLFVNYDGQPVPTKRGITLRLDLLPELAHVLAKFARKADPAGKAGQS